MKFLHLVLASFGVVFTGCYFFGVQGAFSGNNYDILQIEFDGRIYKSPQVLGALAREKLANKQNLELSNQSDDEQKDAKSADDINQVFAQMQARNENESKNALNNALKDDLNLNSKISHLDSTNSSSLKELSQIDTKSTFRLDRVESLIFGVIGCNNYTASFFWQDSNHIVISGAASTRKACYPSEVDTFQNILMQFFDGIYSITRINLSNDKKGYLLDNGRIKIYLQ